MVSFSCESCNETLKKAKVKQHNGWCYGPFTCLDCNVTMGPGQYESHTSCISEAQRYEKSVWKGDKVKGKGKNKQQNGQQPNGQVEHKTPAAPTMEADQAPAPVAESSKTPTVATDVVASASAATADSSTVSKKAKKDKKRKRDAAAQEGEKPSVAENVSDEPLPSTAQDQKVQAKSLNETNGAKTEEDAGKADGAQSEKKEKKKRKKNTDGQTNGSGDGKAPQAGEQPKDTGVLAPIQGEDAKIAEARALGKETVPTDGGRQKQPTKAEMKERMMNVFKMSEENGADLTLKYLLEQAERAGGDRESILGDFKVTSVKKGKFVISLE